MIKLILIIVSILLFCLGYQICFLFYPDFNNHADQWFDMRDIIYSLMIAFAFISLNLKDGKYTKLIKFFSLIGIGFVLSHVIDLLVFDCKEFTWSDLAMIFITLISSYKKVYVRKTETNT
jgi:hypothetical protein